MNYSKNTFTLIALAAIGIIVGIFVAQRVLTPAAPAAEVVEEEVVTETATTTEEAMTEEDTKMMKGETEAPTVTPSPIQVSVETTPSPFTFEELGPREPATVSPLAALQYFVEAMEAGDAERAASYFTESVREGYLTTFKDYVAKDQQHPVVIAYRNGTVEDVELIQPEHGIYEIRVAPAGSASAYTLNFLFENGEFAIWEL